MSYTPTTPIVQELVDYFSEDPAFKAAFELSFMEAYKRYDKLPLWADFNVHTVEDYFRYMDEYVGWMPTEDVNGKSVYNHLCFFYFILDCRALRDYQSPIHPSSRAPWTRLSEWLIKYAQEMGKWMDEPGSINEDTIQTFVNSPPYRDEGVDDFFYQYPRKQWKSFNDFFARHINLTLRPIAAADDPTVIVCPADCAFGDKWRIYEESMVDFHPFNLEATFEAKGVPWSIRQLLDDVSPEYRSYFPGGLFTHAFLNSINYHRMHAPVSGTVIQTKLIPGLCYLEVGVETDPSPDSKDSTMRQHLTMRRRMLKETIISLRDRNTDSNVVAPDSDGYQFLQARALILIKSEIGYVAVLPIGMAQVSSVGLSVKAGDTVKKGDEIAYFQFGGSDIVMVFEKDANVDLSEWEDQRPKVGFTKFGSKIGTADRVTKP